MKNNKLITSLLILVPLFANMFFWWQSSGLLIIKGGAELVIALGRLAGLLAVYCVLLQVVFRSRIILIENAFGFETLNALHKKNGYLIYTFLLLHPLLLTSGYAQRANKNFFLQVFLFLFTYEGVFKALIAVLLFTAVIVSSLYIIRKKLPYELWYLIHLMNYIAILFAWDHQLRLGGDFRGNIWFVYFWYSLYIAVFGSLLYWRFLRHWLLFYQQRFYITNIVRETSDTYSFYIRGKNIHSFYFSSGQFVFFRLLAKDFWWESHPFSLSLPPNKKYLRLTIKGSGDFTKKLQTVKLKTPVLLDGPHGKFTLEGVKKRKLLFIAGGSGITPIRAMIEKSPKNDIILLYASRTKKDIIFKSELDELEKKDTFSPIYFINKNRKKLRKRITVSVIKKLVKDIADREIFICGPDSMVEELQTGLKKSIPKKQIHTEKFTL